jgi:hemerythrin
MGLKNTELPQVANALMNAIHEEEMEIINELYDACLREDGEKVEPLLEFLLAHAEDHFLTEEELMREARIFCLSHAQGRARQHEKGAQATVGKMEEGKEPNRY